MDFVESPVQIARQPRRILRWFLGFVAIVFVAFIVIRFTQQNRIQSELTAIRQAGFPVTLEEADAWYPPVLDEENAALIFLEAADRTIDAPAKSDNLPVVGQADWPAAGGPMTPEISKAIRDYLDDNKDALEAIHKAAQLSKSRYPVDLRQGANTLLPHLAPIKKLTQLLRVEAGYQSSQGKVDLAVRAALDSFALAHSLANEPTLISELVRMACVNITVAGLERTLTEHALTDEQLRTLSEKVNQAEADARTGYVRAMGGGERCMGIDFFTMTTPQKLAPVLGNSPPNPLALVGFTLYRASGLRSTDFSFYLRVLGEMIAAGQKPYPEALKQTREASQRMTEELSSFSGKLRVISRMILPALQKAAEKEATSVGQLRAARSALAVERHRLAHGGQLPDKLNDLVPALLEKLPVDPFDGRPLELETLAKGYRIPCPAALPQWADSPKNKKATALAFTVAR